jgi:hypothetical protein
VPGVSPCYLLYTLVAACALASVYLFGSKLHLLERGRVVSVAGGVSVAYIFVDLLPEMAENQAAFLSTIAGRHLPFPEARVYSAALAGFVIFYGLRETVTRRRTTSPGRNVPILQYQAHIFGFSTYSALIAYLMVHRPHGLVLPLILYTTAMMFHFLIVDRSLRRDYDGTYEHNGRWILAASVLAGWAIAVTVGVPEQLFATLLGFMAGGVVINSTGPELPSGNEWRFPQFMLGAVTYAILLLIAANLEIG